MMKALLKEISSCQVCAPFLEHEPRPVMNASKNSRILVIGQAPGSRVHQTGIPWNDPSGKRLRQWMNISDERFYDPEWIGIVPMGFCYPGKGKSGDLPPRPECAPLWHSRLLEQMPEVELTLLIGQYAQAYYLGENAKRTLTDTVKAYEEYLPAFLPLPHPSPRNGIWLRKNDWFEAEVLPELKKRVARILKN